MKGGIINGRGRVCKSANSCEKCSFDNEIVGAPPTAIIVGLGHQEEREEEEEEKEKEKEEKGEEEEEEGEEEESKKGIGYARLKYSDQFHKIISLSKIFAHCRPP